MVSVVNYFPCFIYVGIDLTLTITISQFPISSIGNRQTFIMTNHGMIKPKPRQVAKEYIIQIITDHFSDLFWYRWKLFPGKIKKKRKEILNLLLKFGWNHVYNSTMYQNITQFCPQTLMWETMPFFSPCSNISTWTRCIFFI